MSKFPPLYKICRIVSLFILTIPILLAQSANVTAKQAKPILKTSSFLTGPNRGSPLTIAQNYLNNNYTSLGLVSDDLIGMVIRDHYTTKHNNTTHIYFQQQHEGIPVYNGLININIATDGSVINAGSQFVRHLANRANRTRPLISPEMALQAAIKELNLTTTQPIRRLRTLNTATNAVILSNSDIARQPILTQLVYQPLENAARLAWELDIYEEKAENWWNIRIDAVTGKELDRFNLVIHEDFRAQMIESHGYLPEPDTFAAFENEELALLAPSSGAQYNVYAMPDESPNHGNIGRTLVTNPATSASPFGWHDTNGSAGAEYTITRGNNVHAYEDGNNSGFSPDCGNALHCDFPIDLSQSADTYESTAIANLFYWNNIIHDLWYEYGFDEASGNFQENNYGNGGNGGDSVNAEAQDGSGTCNANFSTPTDGGNPRMQMYLCNGRDGDLDNGVIVHEYGHGISIRLTGGPSTSSCLNNSEQGGEGWSDWFGLMMTIEVGDQGTDSRGIGTYLFGQGPMGGGIRPQPYSTNMSVNDFTYDDVDAGLSVPHGVGWGWATILWDMNWALVDEYGLDHDFYNGSGGNNLAMQLVIDGLKLQSCSPSFVDARDGILLADQNNNGGANQCLLWDVFARRGLGFSADDNGSALGGEIEAFDTHPACDETLKISKTAVSKATAGDTLQYSLTITNDKPNTLTDVIVSDPLPANTTYVADSATCGGSESGSSITFDLGTMNSGDSEICTFEVTINPSIGSLVLFSEDFEGTLSDHWTTTGYWNQEEESDSCGNLAASFPSSSQAAYYGNDSSCNYLGTNSGSLTLTTPIDLTDVSSAELSFWSYEATEDSTTWDQRFVEISTDGGDSWNTLQQLNELGNWYKVTIELTNYVDNSILLRFRFDSVDAFSNSTLGWLIDDILVTDQEVTMTNTAFVTAGEGDSANDAATTNILASPCQTVANVANIAISNEDSLNHIVEISWDTVANATEYEVWWAINNPYFNPLGGDCGSPGAFGCAIEDSSTAMEHTQSGNVDDTYSYVVVAKNSCGQSSTALSPRVGSFEFELVAGQP